MEVEAQIDHFWDVALKMREISDGLSRVAISEMLELMRQERLDIPTHFKKLFCFKCFTIFEVGKNMKVNVVSKRNHPNLKIVEYHCLYCRNKQAINHLRAKEFQRVNKIEEERPKMKNERRKLLMNIFK